MKKALKIGGSILAVIIVLIIALNLYFTNERLKNTIMPYVNDAVQRPVTVESMSLTFFSTFPQPGVSIENLSVLNKTKTDTLLSLDALTAGVNFFSLFSDQIEVSEIQLVNPQFTYIVYPDSSTNIDFLMQGKEASQDTSGGYAFNIPHFEVISGNFGYRDQTSNTHVQINNLDAAISLNYADLIKSTVDLTIEGVKATVDSTVYLNGLPLHLSQQSTVDLAKEKITIDEGTLSIHGLALNLTGRVSNWSTKPAVNLQFNTPSNNFSEILKLIPSTYIKSIQDLETRGSLTIKGNVNGIIGGDTLPDFDILIDISNGYVKYPDLPEAIEQIQLTARATNEQVNIKTFTAKAAQNTFTAEGKILNPLNTQKRSIDLQADLSFNLGTIKQFYPIDEDTLAIRGQLDANVTLKGKAEEIIEAVEAGTITLKNGFIDHKSLDKPIKDITFKSTLDGPVLTITKAGFKTGDNHLTVEGTITDYLSESRTVDLQLNGQANLTQLTAYYELKPTVKTLTGLADVQLHVSGPPAQPAELNLNGTMTVHNVNMRGEGLVQPVTDLNGEMVLTPSTATLKTLTFNIGSSDISLNGTLSNYMAYLKAEEDRSITPHLKGHYESQLLNMDELINWSDTSSSEPTPIKLPDLKTSVSAEIDTLIVTGVTMYDIQGQASTTPTQIDLEEASAKLLGGMATGSFVWKVPQPDHTAITFNGTLDSLKASAFFKEFGVLGADSKFHQYIHGTFSAEVSYFSELNKFLTPLLKTSTMKGSFGMSKARLKDYPLQLKLANFLHIEALKKAAIDQWKSTFKLDDKILTFKKLRLTSDDIGLELNGTQHLGKGTLNDQVKIYLPKQFKDDIASVITQKAADALTTDKGTIMVPLRITGTFNNPKIRPDQKVIKPIIKDYLKGKATDALKNLFGN